MKKIFANNNKNAYAIVDDDIAETIKDMKLKFCINNYGYCILTKWIQLPCMNKKKQLLLHHLVWILKTGEQPSSTVDHIDRNKSNNVFENLRLATMQEQSQHRGKQKSNTSGYIGVSYKHDKRRENKNGYWLTSIRKPDGHTKVKLFPFTEAGKIAAAKYYDTKAIQYFGKFHGELNFTSPSDKDK